MSIALETYHSDFYPSSCPHQSSFFRSRSYIVYPLHFSNVFFIPLSLLTAYCILYKTPRQMRPLKWVYLNLHFWTSLQSISISLLITPLCWFPTFSVSMLGLLSKIGVPEVLQAYLAMSVMMLALSSIVSLFENRHHMIKENQFRISRPLLRYSLLGCNYLYSILYTIPLLFHIPDQTTAKLAVLNTIPCPYEDFFTLPIYTLTTNHAHRNYMIYSTLICSFFKFLQINFYSFTCLHYLVFRKTKTCSRVTNGRQKKFFLGILLQVSIPYAFMIPGMIYVSCAVLTNTYNQKLNNLTVLSVNLYGTVATLGLLFGHRPYRIFVKKLIGLPEIMPPGGKPIIVANRISVSTL